MPSPDLISEDFSPEEERLDQLQAHKKSLEFDLASIRKKLAEVNEELRDLAPRVEVIRRNRDWEQGEPARAAMRATPEWQEWRRNFLAEQEEHKRTLDEGNG